MGIRLDLSQLLALFLETLVYGVFLTLFIAAIALLSAATTNATHRRQRQFVLPVATAMLAIATSHLVVDFVRVVEAFVMDVNEPGGATAYYEHLSNPLQVTKTVFYVTQTTIGDGVLIWRYYVIYGKKILFTLPLVIVLLVNTAAGYIVCWSLSQAQPGSTIFHTASKWITTFFVLTMCINVTTTGAIAWRVMASVRKNSAVVGGRGNLVPVIVVIVESGALYAGSVLALLISYLTGSNGQYPALDLITPLVGVVFLLIILQIRFHVGRDTTFQTSVLNSSSTVATGLASNSRIVSPFMPRPMRIGHGDDSVDGFPLHPVAVKIRQEREVHRGSEFEDVMKVGPVGNE